METRRIRLFVGGVCVALVIVGVTLKTVEGSRANAAQPENRPPTPVVVLNDENAPVAITGIVAKAPPVRFQDLLALSSSDGSEECEGVPRIEGKRKVVEQVAFEVRAPDELTGHSVYLLAAGEGNLLRITPELVKDSDDTSPFNDLWGGRFEGPFLVNGQFLNEPGARFLSVCAKNHSQVRAWAVGVIEDLPQ